MSEAVHPNHDSASPRSDAPNPSAVPAFEPAPATAAAKSEEDWQTVDFPGAIPIADLLQSSSITAASADSPTAVTGSDRQPPQPAPSEATAQSSDDLQRLVQYLRGENSSLRNQIVQLEQDLAQVQVELQLEVARFYCKEADQGAPEQTAAAGAGVQEQMQPLTQRLEQSEQTVQQQQLVDCLTEQLATSQERIAHLERDCALSQQRYAEQVQLATQLENTCRDLRMRLHRQQQQTLQFKAALEKSLEMSPVISSDHIVSNEPLISASEVEHSESTAFIPKAQPVKPWSKTPESAGVRGHATAARSPGKELPNLLKLFNTDTAAHSHPSDVLGAEVAPVDPATPPAELLALSQNPITPELTSPAPSAAPDLDALFPDVPPIAIVTETTAQDAIFDLSPFLEAGEVDPATIAAVQPVAPTEAIAQPALVDPAPIPESPTPIPLPENNLWADLARLIEPDMVAENAAIAPDLTIEVEPQVIDLPSHQRLQAIVAQEPTLQPAASHTETAESVSAPQLVNPFAQPAPETTWAAEMQPGSPFITLKSPTAASSAANAAFPEPPIPTVSSLEPPAESPPGLPSPVLHPFRPNKKLKSMASVELPSFPRTAEQ